jgi:hypothetical protein
MFVHSYELWCLACQARSRAAAAIEKSPESLASDAVASFVLAAAATEAFINELAELAAVQTASPSWQDCPAPQLSALATKVAAVEARQDGYRGTIEEKYQAASVALGKPFDKGAAPFQDFRTLVRLRNDLMHMKPRGGWPGADASVYRPNYLRGLQLRGLARKVEGDPGMSWFACVQTGGMARWACGTAQSVILAVLDMIPAGSRSLTDGLQVLFRMPNPASNPITWYVPPQHLPGPPTSGGSDGKS